MSTIKTEIREGITIITWGSDKLMGGPETLKLRDAVARLIDDGARKLVVDFSQVTLSNSTGLGTLLSAWTIATNNDAELVVVLGSDRIENIFHVTNLDSIMKIFRSIDDAVASFGE
jgi:anti-sigma B factor antagonist